ncbi:rubredoxin-NAD(+) reductase, putative [Entamoeba dispar SAW760]|uniref:Rubredoxin-NAD(+) reductase, putative n=1 Tax=Entamoeba dispar (strain ATCC PRA-260 / SAW760) TaxID=370354 RepID=B0EDB2_ENTDS|nr:rubredoxin-NAD(+) reductase, putative [Entamoeba dispar SAW760]EDR27529.1 rubredoxin-NAD(+) reductase, putative [Entamoeba dispar SAW760]|eukprot:EDR27529.1 rubredoxin-NAD(+) reductase, putative [Entamoeba dispar SAW760]
MNINIQYRCDICSNTQLNEDKCQCCGSESLKKEEYVKENSQSSLSSNLEVVIVGGGIASLSVIRCLIEKGIHSITLICKEKHFPYYRTAIPKILLDPPFCNNPQFFIEQKKFYQKNKINILLGFTVKLIDLKNSIVIAEKDLVRQEIPFSKLVLAVGGEPNKPPFIQQSSSNDIIPIHSIADMEAINSLFETRVIKQVAIIGAGLSGIEISNALRRKSAKVTVTLVEIADRILPRQLSKTASKVFMDVLLKNGIQLKLNSQIKAILCEGNTKIIEFSNGENITCDLICYSCGIKSSVQLAQSIGCKINHGIIVNEYMQTNVSNVFACGDCCEYNGRCYGNWTDSMKQGIVCGKAIIGEFTKYIHTPMPYFVFSFIGVYSVGIIEGESILKQNGNEFMEIFLKDGCIIGGNLLGKIITKVQRDLVTSIERKTEGEEAQLLIEKWKTYF